MNVEACTRRRHRQQVCSAGTDLFADALQRDLAPVVGNIEITTLSVPWPETPLHYNDEVKEFLGDPVAVAALAQEADVLLTHVAPVTQAVLDAAPTLRMVRCRGGPVNVNVAAATTSGIPVVDRAGAQLAGRRRVHRRADPGGVYAASGGRAPRLRPGVWLGDLYRYDRTGRLAWQDDRAGGLGAIAQSLVAYLQPFRGCASSPTIPSCLPLAAPSWASSR